MEDFESARTDCYVEDLHWIAGKIPNSLKECGQARFKMKIRHGPKITEGVITLKDDKEALAHIKLDHKDGGLAPGQFIAIYNIEDSECLGSGVISEHHWVKVFKNIESKQSKLANWLY